MMAIINQFLKFSTEVRFSKPLFLNHVLLATLVKINDYKAQSNCNQDPFFKFHSCYMDML